MAEINLLPTTDKAPSSVTKVSSLSKKIGTIVSIVLLVVLLVYASIYAFFYVNGSVTTSSITSLENQVKAQEATEQKIVLLRDRTSKVSKIINSSNSEQEMTSLSGLLGKLPEGVMIREAKVEPNEINVLVQADQSSQITEFIRTLTESGIYSQIESTSINFTGKERYLASFRLALGEIQTQ